MADSTTPFTRSEWNQIIQDINAIVPSCEGVDALVEVDECHRLSITDITDVQDKLVELCDTNEFTAPDMKWLKSTIQEIEDAIIEGECCCEEQDWPYIFDLYHFDYRLRFVNLDGGLTQLTLDWAEWMAQIVTTLSVTEEECPGENPEDPPTTIEVREGGPFWVGTEFKFWDLYIFNGDGTEPSTAPRGDIKFTGIVQDGYMVLPPSLGGTNPTCSEPATGDFDLGTTDPLLGSPFEITAYGESPESETVEGVNGYSNVVVLNGDFSYPEGQLTPDDGGDTPWSITLTPFFIANPGSEISGFFDAFIRDYRGAIVLRCSEPEEE
jgi:hypothetical protein